MIRSNLFSVFSGHGPDRQKENREKGKHEMLGVDIAP
jgi:hypothetical protein